MRTAQVPSTQQKRSLAVLFDFALLLGACFAARRRAAPHGRSGGRGGASRRHGAPSAPHATENAQIEPHGAHFDHFWGQGRKLLKLSILGLILPLLRLRLENAQIEPPGAHFGHFWGQGQKMLKLSLLGLILVTSGAKARKCSN